MPSHNSNQMRRSAISLAALVVLAIGADSCRAQDRSGATPHQTASPKSPLPPNYRSLIAEYLRARNHYVVRDAKMTAPYERWGGLFRGGTFTAICVAVFRDNPFGIVVRDNWVVAFEDTRVRPVALGTERCEPLMPFPELMRALARGR